MDNVSSFYSGRHIIRNGNRAQKFFRSGDFFLEYYHIHFKDFKRFNINVDKNIVVKGCFKTNLDKL